MLLMSYLRNDFVKTGFSRKFTSPNLQRLETTSLTKIGGTDHDSDDEWQTQWNVALLCVLTGHWLCAGVVSATTVSREMCSPHVKEFTTWCRYWMIQLLSLWPGYVSFVIVCWSTILPILDFILFPHPLYFRYMCQYGTDISTEVDNDYILHLA